MPGVRFCSGSAFGPRDIAAAQATRPKQRKGIGRAMGLNSQINDRRRNKLCCSNTSTISVSSERSAHYLTHVSDHNAHNYRFLLFLEFLAPSFIYSNSLSQFWQLLSVPFQLKYSAASNKIKGCGGTSPVKMTTRNSIL